MTCVLATDEIDDGYQGGCRLGEPNQLAGGGYVGLQIASRKPWFFAFYVGVRYQLTVASEIPLTHWLQYGVGFQFYFTRSQRVFVTHEFGLGHFRNSQDVSWGFYNMISVGVRYGKASRQPPPPPPRQRP